jgi:hypothetical protein
MIRQDLIPLEDRAAWRQSLEGIPHGFGHTWESCRAAARSSGAPTFLYRFQDGPARVVCPLAERGQGWTRDLATPYGFGGFAGTGGGPLFRHRFRDFLRRRGYVCAYIGLHPVLTGGDWAGPGEAHVYNSVHVLDLTAPEETLFARLSENRRREVRAFDRARSEKTVELVEDRDALARFFLDHYEEFYRSRSASPLYFFSRDTLLDLFALDNVLLLGVAGPEGIEAVSVFGWTPYLADFLHNVSVPGGERHSAPLIWQAARRLHALRIPFLCLGGGIREGDGVARFKERFGGERRPLAALRQVYDRERYAELCRLAGVDPEAEGYFPPYRNPRASAGTNEAPALAAGRGGR